LMCIHTGQETCIMCIAAKKEEENFHDVLILVT
jgi:hypothetical protein